jgi:hypothetical protein
MQPHALATTLGHGPLQVLPSSAKLNGFTLLAIARATQDDSCSQQASKVACVQAAVV